MRNTKKAYEILNRVINEHAYANLLLQQVNDDYNIGFITQLVYGTLRNFKLVNSGWHQFVKNDLSNEISVLLDLGVYMLYDIKNTPDYAIVNNIVEISKGIEYRKYTKLVNAVLKRFNKEGFRVFDENNIEDLSILYSHPLWMSKLFASHYSFEIMKKLLAYNNENAKVTLRVNTHKISKADLLLKDANFKSGSFAPEEVYYDGDIFKTDYFKEGLVSIQDSASQMVAHILNAKDEDKVLDATSAPGSKTMHIAILRNDKGSIDAVELYENRAKLIENEKEKLNLSSINVITFDARNLEAKLEVESYDKVLVDAPCSGFGVMRQKPEIKINTKPEDLDSLVKLQSEILDSAIKMVKLNGELVYSTCTLNKKENEKQVERILKLNDNFMLISEETIFGYTNNSDSFYIAKIKRVK